MLWGIVVLLLQASYAHPPVEIVRGLHAPQTCQSPLLGEESVSSAINRVTLFHTISDLKGDKAHAMLLQSYNQTEDVFAGLLEHGYMVERLTLTRRRLSNAAYARLEASEYVWSMDGQHGYFTLGLALRKASMSEMLLARERFEAISRLVRSLSFHVHVSEGQLHSNPMMEQRALPRIRYIIP